MENLVRQFQYPKLKDKADEKKLKKIAYRIIGLPPYAEAIRLLSKQGGKR
jgi:hypothetical protein